MCKDEKFWALFGLAIMKKYIKEILSVFSLLAFFLTYNLQFYLPLFPGYAIFQAIAFLLFLYWISRLGKETGFSSIFAFFLAWNLWTFLSVLWAKDSWIVMESLQKNFTVLCFFVGWECVLVHNSDLRKRMGYLLVIGFLILGLSYLGNLIFYRFSLEGRFRYPFANPNLAGSILGFALIFCLFFFLCQKKYLWTLACSSLLFALVMLSHSKASLLSVSFCFLVFLFVLFPKARFGLVSICLILGMLGSWKFSYFLERIWASVEIRLFLWEGAWNMVCHSPFSFLLGWGSGNFFSRFPDFQDRAMYSSHYAAEIVECSHNFYLDTWVEYGIIGLFLFLLLSWKIFQTSWNIYKNSPSLLERSTALGLFASSIMALCDAFFSVSFTYFQGQILFVLAIVWLSASCQKKAIVFFQGKERLIKLLFCFCCLFFFFFWKLSSWDFLKFHWHYKKALRSAENTRLSDMHDAPCTAWENLYTLEWRCMMGAVLYDSYKNAIEDESLQIFLRIEKYMPKFGYFLLYKAMLHARQGHKEKSDEYFIQYASKNPFSADLWIYWSMAAIHQNADASKMLETARFYKQKYSGDLTPLLGEALALHCLKKRKESLVLMEELHDWAYRRFQKWPVKRVKKILDITVLYIGKK